MREILILTETELRDCVALNLSAIDTIEDVFRALARGEVEMPPITSMEIAEHHGDLDVKTAYIPGFDGFAVKISPGFFNNPSLGLPSVNGLMVVLASKTGLVDAVLLDNGYLTDLRTAAAGAVAARHLAPEQVDTAMVFGAGVQARLQMQAAHLVRPFKRVLVWGRDAEKAAACARDLGESLGMSAEAVTDAAAAVAQSQLVVTTTPSTEPFFKRDWLHPGLHITAMGSDLANKSEITPKALAAADLYVVDHLNQCATMGELREARDAGLMMDVTPPELGHIVEGMHKGRVSNSDITICDLTGTGAQDTAIATVALAAARVASKGVSIST
ncbi:cyclodeaminase [Pseudohalocynthiibacter aestuariivivens]|jgi:ectoine utilization protein EutC|uniref:Cyclodeaminase n=1 Tax=Pseudohalocynthiibacter aestuariivivens TaxID=1591409 RepID=A0ABV5JDY9_9RHOB|nr:MULTISPECIES: cyclodeaminase [Pseudohalocynthiibacter]MBS9718063.1 cyclodeaminase [Pseudohalocynthiibacter aestuariivivens]MCK0103272.1 cyclodeaminase [Pseudohalocynthiibacter sp. F2068]